MTLEQLEQEVIALSESERQHLVSILLQTLQKNNQPPELTSSQADSLAKLHPWTKSLLGWISLEDMPSQDSYVDDLEKKYR